MTTSRSASTPVEPLGNVPVECDRRRRQLLALAQLGQFRRRDRCQRPRSVRRHSLSRVPRKQASWNYPEGDLSSNQRHRSKFWLNYRPTFARGLSLSLLETVESGVPYGGGGREAIAPNGSVTSGVDPRSYVVNPGYLTPPTGSNITYYYTARDAFRTEGQVRTDVAINYAYRIPGVQALEFFGQAQIINVFNQSQLCVCGGTAFGYRFRTERWGNQYPAYQHGRVDTCAYSNHAAVQPLHDCARSGGELEPRTKLRQSDQSIRIYDAAVAEAFFWRSLLTGAASRFTSFRRTERDEPIRRDPSDDHERRAGIRAGTGARCGGSLSRGHKRDQTWGLC